MISSRGTLIASPIIRIPEEERERERDDPILCVCVCVYVDQLLLYLRLLSLELNVIEYMYMYILSTFWQSLHFAKFTNEVKNWMQHRTLGKM